VPTAKKSRLSGAEWLPPKTPWRSGACLDNALRYLRAHRERGAHLKASWIFTTNDDAG
jgi:hypothetical protein